MCRLQADWREAWLEEESEEEYPWRTGMQGGKGRVPPGWKWKVLLQQQHRGSRGRIECQCAVGFAQDDIWPREGYISRLVSKTAVVG